MKEHKVTTVPEVYMHAVKKELHGTIVEVFYEVSNYINHARQFVTNQNSNVQEIGRESIQGPAITKACNIYLPAGYNKNDKETRYNTLYLLHGVGGDRFEWLTGNGKIDDNYVVANMLDNLIANGDIEPMIVVFVEGRSAIDWTDCSFNPNGTNMLGFYYLDYELRYDLIPFIESEFHTYSNIGDKSSKGITYNRLHRAIAGLSMGGMQVVNLVLGGFRCDSEEYTGTKGIFENGLDITVTVPGMEDLFTYVGAFSNAPTSSDGKLLGTKISSCGYNLDLLYITCGDADDISYSIGYMKSINGLEEAARNRIGCFYKVVIKDAVHDFNVWNNGVYNFSRLSFQKMGEKSMTYDITIDPTHIV